MTDSKKYLQRFTRLTDKEIKCNLADHLARFGVRVDPDKFTFEQLHKMIEVVTGVYLLEAKMRFAGCTHCKPTN